MVPEKIKQRFDNSQKAKNTAEAILLLSLKQDKGNKPNYLVQLFLNAFSFGTNRTSNYYQNIRI
ncbi:MAG: hypothetical protein ACI819_000103 [Neolewinella sp.]|jgi:hypothetical protein